MSRERQRGEASCRQGRGRKRQPAASLRRRRGRAHLGRSSRLAALRGLVAELVDLSLQATDALVAASVSLIVPREPARCVRGPVWATKTGRLVIQNRKDLYFYLTDTLVGIDAPATRTLYVSAGARAARTRTATALNLHTYPMRPRGPGGRRARGKKRTERLVGGCQSTSSRAAEHT